MTPLYLLIIVLVPISDTNADSGDTVQQHSHSKNQVRHPQKRISKNILKLKKSKGMVCFDSY